MSEESTAHPPPVPDHLLDYRKHLVAAEQKAQEDFDKTVLSLSGGALGVSFVFLKDIVGANPIAAPNFLLAAWVCWGLSTLFVLGSYFMSQQALRDAIRQTDLGQIYGQKPGGRFADATAVFNALGAVLFLVGVLCITVFAGRNFPTTGVTDDRKKGATTSSSAPATTSTACGEAERTQRSANGGVHSSAASTAAAK